LQIDQNKRLIDVKVNSLELAKEQLKLAEAVHQQANLKFTEGLIGTNDLLQAQTSLEQAQTGVVAAYVALRQAELEYLKSNGNIK
jgi:outer membrane protein TolC